MATAQLVLLLAAFIGGIYTVELPGYRLGIGILVVAALLYGPRVRAALFLALASGIFDAYLQDKGPSLPAPHSLNAPVLVIDTLEKDNGTLTTLLLDDSSQGEAWFKDNQAPLFGHSVYLTGDFARFDEARNPGITSPETQAAQRGNGWRLLHPAVRRDLGMAIHDPRIWLPLARRDAGSRLKPYLDPLSLALLTGVLWGDRNSLPISLHDALASTSTIHVVITAGLHVGIVWSGLTMIFKACRLSRACTASISVLMLMLYAALVGGEFPVLRATLCAIFSITARTLGTAAQGRRGLVIALIIIIAAIPSAPTRTGFWLSVCCVGTIAAFYRPLHTRLAVFPPFLREGLALSLAAQLGTWPIIVYVMHHISFIAPIANLIVVPMIPLLMSCGVLLLVFSGITSLCNHLAPVTGLLPQICSSWISRSIGLSCAVLAHGIAALVPFLAQTPNGEASFSDPPLVAVVFSYCALALAAAFVTQPDWLRVYCTQWTHVLKQRGLSSAIMTPRRTVIALLALAELTPFVGSADSLLSHDLKITVLDVGQGDGIVVETPRHNTILIDTGGRLELHANIRKESSAERAGGNILLPFLAHEGIRRIDLMVLTHPHGDHVGGAAPVLRTMPVGAILDSGQPYTGRAFSDAMALASAKHVPVLLAHRGDRFITNDAVQFDVLAPFAQALPSINNAINEGSIILRLGFANRHMLFMGDAGIPTENRLLAAGTTLQSDYLKVGHHGSAGATSQAFLQAVHPQLAVISVGRHNLFHHPAERTLHTLTAEGITVLRTDRCGAVILSLLTVKTMLPCAQLHSFSR